MKHELAKFFKHTLLKKNEVITDLHDLKFTPNVRLGIVAIVKKLPKKKDYLPDILHMKSQGMTFKNIGKTLNMDPSYVCKLFHAATDKFKD